MCNEVGEVIGAGMEHKPYLCPPVAPDVAQAEEGAKGLGRSLLLRALGVLICRLGFAEKPQSLGMLLALLLKPAGESRWRGWRRPLCAAVDLCNGPVSGVLNACHCLGLALR